MSCKCCDGSGVMNIVKYSATNDNPFKPLTAGTYASYCHGCPAGDAWKEAFEEVKAT